MPKQNPHRNTAKQDRTAPRVHGSGFTENGEPVDSIFRDLVEAAQCMIVIIRSDGSIAYLNAFAAELTGYRNDELLGRDFFATLVPGSIRAEVEKHFYRVACGSAGCEIEHPLVAKGSTFRWVVSSLRSFTDSEESPVVLLTAQDITVRKHTEEKLQQRTHDLHERIKELNCLFGLSKLVEEPGIDLDGILRGLVDNLPPAWQYPGETCAQIVFSGRIFRSYNFQATRWKQSTPIEVYGTDVGVIEVYYLAKKPDAYEGPFLNEERRLIDALAEQLGRIAERIEAERSLRRERDFAESLIETAPAIVLVVDADGRIVRINPYMEEISGYRRDDVEGKDWFDTFLPKAIRQRTRRAFRKSLGKRQRRGTVSPIVMKDGRRCEIEWYDKTLEDASGNVIGLLAIGQDITARRALEREIADISTREQQRIGQELHDGLGQELTGLGYLAETLLCDLRERSAPEAATVDRLSRGIEHALGQARNIARGLVPMEIDADGLTSALAQLATSTQEHCGVVCEFCASSSASVSDTAAATQVFRIVQEAVNNAAKHASASRIVIEFDGGDAQTSFRVRDNGIGISPNLDQSPGMGLRIMQHRAGMIGATLTVQAVDGGGTIVNCTLPGSDS